MPLPDPFLSATEATAACQAIGLDTTFQIGLDTTFQTNGLGVNGYWITEVHTPQRSTYSCYGDADFLAWANAYFRDIVAIRRAAGWTTHFTGWLSPEGDTETEWINTGLPLPEDASFADWFLAYYHHEALDNGIDPTTLNPYPDTPEGCVVLQGEQGARLIALTPTQPEQVDASPQPV